jgi:recombination protein U
MASKKSTRGGYKWEDTLKKSILETYPDAFIYKLIDTHSIEGLLTKLKKNHIQYKDFLIPKVPADFIAVCGGQTVWIEAKNTVNDRYFPLGNIKQHQLEFASLIEGAGGKYFFAIRRQEPRNNEVFLLTLNDIIRITQKSGRKSLLWPELRKDQFILKCPQVKGSKYDMRGLFPSD